MKIEATEYKSADSSNQRSDSPRSSNSYSDEHIRSLTISQRGVLLKQLAAISDTKTLNQLVSIKRHLMVHQQQKSAILAHFGVASADVENAVVMAEQHNHTSFITEMVSAFYEPTTELMEAAYKNHLRLMTHILSTFPITRTTRERGYEEKTMTDVDAHRALPYAALSGHCDAINLLFALGKDLLNIRPGDGAVYGSIEQATRSAASKGHKEATELLLTKYDQYANPQHPPGLTIRSALEGAAEHNQADIVDLILQRIIAKKMDGVIGIQDALDNAAKHQDIDSLIVFVDTIRSNPKLLYVHEADHNETSLESAMAMALISERPFNAILLLASMDGWNEDKREKTLKEFAANHSYLEAQSVIPKNIQDEATFFHGYLQQGKTLADIREAYIDIARTEARLKGVARPGWMNKILVPSRLLLEPFLLPQNDLQREIITKMRGSRPTITARPQANQGRL